MSTSTTDAFLNGEDIRVDPRAIEAELIRLWGPAAERSGGPTPENPNVTRIVLANLIVVGRAEDESRLAPVLDVVLAQFPSRAIVLRLGREPGRAVEAEVSALCHLPAPGMPQVCSERIILRASHDASDLLPGSVRPLLEADLPVVLWWTDDPREDVPLFEALVDEASRLIIDLPDPAADVEALRKGLDPGLHPFSRDAAWFGITPWRELVAKFFDPPCNEGALDKIKAVRISATSPDIDRTPRQAAWVIAWLAGQLGWGPVGSPKREPGLLTATFNTPRGEVAVEIHSTADASINAPVLMDVSLSIAGDETFRLTRQGTTSPEVHIQIKSSRACALPRSVASPKVDEAHRVAAGLESARKDVPFQRALPHVLWLLGG
ncbi:glucose-6-phosphate dehydrogenase assembly protein OpcA [Isosphaeraceae bacterium EP7]